MKTILYLLITISLVGCDSFLDVKPKGKLVPQTVEDFDLMLNDLGVTTGADIALKDPYLMIDASKESALWGTNLSSAIDAAYNQFYSNLYTCNFILENIDVAESVSGSDELRKVVKRDALADRAATLFLLANNYGHHYSVTADKDIATPIKLNTNIEEDIPNGTIKEFYTQIIEDLTEAKTIYNQDNERIYNCSRASNLGIDGLFAKVYLFMNDHEAAFTYANACLNNHSKLYNYNDLEAGEVPVRYYSNEENIWFKTPKPAVNFIDWRFSADIAELFDKANDFRWTFYAGVENADGSYSRNDVQQVSPNSLVSVADILLIRAECYAKMNEVEKACDDLHTLRSTRVNADSYTKLETTDKDVALSWIKEERVRELAFSVNNLWDLKRYYAEGRDVPTFTRNWEVLPETYTLEPGSDKYYLEIPAEVFELSDQIKPNK